MSSASSFIFVEIKLIFIRLVLHLKQTQTWKWAIHLIEHHTAGKDMMTGLFTFNAYFTKPQKMVVKKLMYVNFTAKLEDHMFPGFSSRFNPRYPPILLLSQFQFANILHTSFMKEDCTLIIFPNNSFN